MFSRPNWFGGKAAATPASAGVDPELWAIFQSRAGRPDPELLRTAEEIRRQLHSQPPADPAPELQARLRASLMREARALQRARRRPRLLGLPLATAGGLIGLAAVAVVVVSLLAVPLQRGQVVVQTSVAGHHRLPVTQAIRISFNRPMNEAAVVQGLAIKPAVSYQTSWPNPETLVISPVHGLVPNVGYVVTISQPDAKAQNGAEAASAIVIPFGTGSAPSTPAGQIPTVVSVTHEAVTDGITSLTYMPDGALLVLSTGTPLAVAASAQSPSPSPTPPQHSAATPSLTFGTLYVLSPALQAIATDATGAVASPDSQEIAYWSPSSSGSLSLDVVAASGSGSPETLATSTATDPGLAWLDNGDILYSAAGQLHQVSLDGQITTVDPTVHLAPEGFFSLSPSGQELLADPGGVPTLYSLPTGTATVLASLVGAPAWSPTGTGLAYVAASGGTDSLELITNPSAPSKVLLTAAAGIQLSDLSFDPSATYLTYVSTSPGVGAQVTALDVQSQVSGPLGTQTGATDPVWDPAGGQLSELAEVSGTPSQDVDSLLLSGGPAPPASADTAAEAALTTASELAQFQVTDAATALTNITALLTPGTNLSSAVLLPGKFDRFYAVSTSPTAAGAHSYSVALRLVRDATSSSGPAYLPETIIVQTGGTASLISSISQGTLTPVPIGPLVVSASATASRSGTTVFAVHFDADLNPLTVGPQSITLSVNGHLVTGGQFNYSGLTRTETITVNDLPAGAVTLTVAAPLADVNNTAMQSAYQVVLQPQRAPNS
ncbi:MAG: TolB family protein [Candidatus Dormibacteria bacterium]